MGGPGSWALKASGTLAVSQGWSAMAFLHPLERVQRCDGAPERNRLPRSASQFR